MHYEEAIVKYAIRNRKYGKNGYGVELLVNIMNFEKNILTVDMGMHNFVTPHFKSSQRKHIEQRYVTDAVSFELKKMFAADPYISAIKIADETYLFDEKSYFFENASSYMPRNPARFYEHMHEFAQPQNGLYVMSIDVANTFEEHLVNFAKKQQKKLFASDLAHFAKQKAMMMSK